LVDWVDSGNWVNLVDWLIGLIQVIELTQLSIALSANELFNQSTN
jgi:hypothetical protein